MFVQVNLNQYSNNTEDKFLLPECVPSFSFCCFEEDGGMNVSVR